MEPAAPRNASISIVVPLHNEEDCVGTLIDRLEKILLPPQEWKLILVDDGSSDATWRHILKETEHRSWVRGVRLSRNFGKEAALSAGLRVAAGDAVIVMDGDLQHPPELIPRMLEAWTDGADIVEARKSHRGHESLPNALAAKTFYRLLRRVAKIDLDGTSDFKLLDRRALEAWRLLPERNLFFRGMTYWIGFERVELPFEVNPREGGGRGRWSIGSLMRLAITGVTAFSSAPLHIVTGLGGIFVIFGAILGALTMWRWAIGDALSGFTTVILAMLLTGGFIMVGLGIIGTYLARIYDEVKRRPRYLVAHDTSTPDSTRR